MKLKSICVFCGSNDGTDPEFAENAVELGKYLAENGIRLVYGGGRVGLMGRIADAVLENGGEVTGIIPYSLAEKEVAHQSLTALHVVDSMHERKAMMENLSDGFIAMPGGFGTFEELCEMITWAQLGLHGKPCGILNVKGYYDGLLEMFDNAMQKAFVRPEHRGLLNASASVEDLMVQMSEYKTPIKEKWLDRDSS